MQYLVELSIAFAKSRDKYSEFIQNTILDFICSNPPRFGVNWTCTMDVSIRLVNWFICLDILLKNNAQINDKFLKIVRKSIVSHYKHILNNLEWSPDLRGNHYYSNLIGIIFSLSYFEGYPKYNSLKKWVLNEFRKETYLQLILMGNFEGSSVSLLKFRISILDCLYHK